MKKLAFTLAEVLITLGIIGVVAAITLPELIQHHNKVVWVNQLKKSFSTLENGFKMALADEQVDSVYDLSFWPMYTINAMQEQPLKTFYRNLNTYFKFSDQQIEDSPIAPLNTGMSYSFPGFIKLSDGSKICTAAIRGKEDSSSLYYTFLEANVAAGIILVDVNGDKSPNKTGRDIFALLLYENGKLEPYGSYSSAKEFCGGTMTDFCYNAIPYWKNGNERACPMTKTNGFTSNNFAPTCAGRIIENGWKMDY